MSEVPSRKQEQFIVRFPEGMRERIKAAADENNRSMNAEIVLALEAWLDFDPEEEERYWDELDEQRAEMKDIKASLKANLEALEEMKKDLDSMKEKK